MLKFYNQLTKQVDDFKPLVEGQVSLYTCGPTVYNYLTIGNWSAYVYWDTLVRMLRALDYEVNHVMNITDVGHLVSDADDGEDKLEKGAKRDGKTAWEVAKFYTDDFLNSMKLLNINTQTHLPHATDYIPQQLNLVRRLKNQGFTYQISDGIYFDTAKFPTYADFANLNLAALRAGARVEYNQEKRNPSDFALWKFTPANQTRDMQWDTPADITEDNMARPGFPGWHLECSTMAMDLLGETIDIHTGGIDHIPVHHTNEISQSEAATGVIFARYWLHNNHLKINGTKISKSLGNGYTLQDVIAKGYSPLDLRLFLLQSHYKTEGNFTFENLTAAQNRRLHWRNVAARRHQIHDTIAETNNTAVNNSQKGISLYAANRAVLEAMADDLNTPAALALIDKAFDTISALASQEINYNALVSFLENVDDLFGLDIIKTTPDISDDIKRLIVERNFARDKKDFSRADAIRQQLEKEGIVTKDTPSGTVWEYSR